MVQWLRLCTSTPGDVDLISAWGTKIPHDAWHSQKVKMNNHKIFSDEVSFQVMKMFQIRRHESTPEHCTPSSQERARGLCVCCSVLTKSRLTLVTPWTVALQAPLSMGFSRQEYWSGSPLTSSGDGTCVSYLTGRFFTTERPGKPNVNCIYILQKDEEEEHRHFVPFVQFPATVALCKTAVS